MYIIFTEANITEFENKNVAATATIASATTADPIKALVIPEKASSFRIHPGKLCQDQCFYCGGKFGLFDTPCHVAQIKSLERQKNILDSMFFKMPGIKQLKSIRIIFMSISF